MSDHKGPPSRVYIQWYGDGDPELDGPLIDPYEGVTWAANKVFDHDIKYIRDDVAEQRVAAERDSRNRAYRERNQLVAALSKIFPSYLAKHKDTGQNWDPEWCNIVYVDGPAGQMGWHIHASDLDLFEHLGWRENNWDGHDTPEKYERLNKIGNPVAAEREQCAQIAQKLADEYTLLALDEEPSEEGTYNDGASDVAEDIADKITARGEE